MPHRAGLDVCFLCLQKPTSGVVYVCSAFAPWQVGVLKFLDSVYVEVWEDIPAKWTFLFESMWVLPALFHGCVCSAGI